MNYIRLEPVLQTGFLGEGTYTAYAEPATKVRYRRMLGGFAWPAGAEPGACVILGEKLVKDRAGDLHIVALAWGQDEDPDALLLEMQRLGRLTYCSEWVGPVDDEVYYPSLRQSRERSRKAAERPLAARVPRLETLEQQYEVLRKRNRSAQTVWPWWDDLTQALAGLPVDDEGRLKGKLWDYPLAASFLVALSELDLTRPRDARQTAARVVGPGGY